MKYVMAKNVRMHKGTESSIVSFIDRLDYVLELNTIGAEILELCDGNNCIDDIRIKLLDEYDSSEKEVDNVINDFISNALAERIVEIYDGTVSVNRNITGSFLVDAPMSLSLEVTKKCPMRCIHCYVDAQPNNNLYIPYEDISKVLDEASKMGVFSIMLTGGEIFEHKDILKIIEIYAPKFNKFILNTSGFYINDDIIKVIKKNVTQVRISLDGDKEIHNQIRNNPKAYDSAINAISRLSSNDINTAVIMTITKINMHQIEYVANLAKTIGSKSFEYGFVLGLGRCDKELELTTEETICLNHKASQLKKELNSESFSIVSREDAYREITKQYKPVNCGAGFSQISILADGDVVPCLTMPIHLKMGNIYNGTLTDILCSELSSKMKKLKSPPTDECIDCKDKDVCAGCFAKALLVNPNCKWSEKFKVGCGITNV